MDAMKSAVGTEARRRAKIRSRKDQNEASEGWLRAEGNMGKVGLPLGRIGSHGEYKKSTWLHMAFCWLVKCLRAKAKR